MVVGRRKEKKECQYSSNRSKFFQLGRTIGEKEILDVALSWIQMWSKRNPNIRTIFDFQDLWSILSSWLDNSVCFTILRKNNKYGNICLCLHQVFYILCMLLLLFIPLAGNKHCLVQRTPDTAPHKTNKYKFFERKFGKDA